MPGLRECYGSRMNLRTRVSWLIVVAGLLVVCGVAPQSVRAQDVLTPQAAIERAFAQNPDARVARLRVDQARTQLQAAQGARVPTFVAGTSASYNERLSGTRNPVDNSSGIARNNSRTIAGSAGLRYTSDWGTALSLDVATNTQWQQLNPTPATNNTINIGPNYSASTTLTVRQPLLRGAGSEGQLGAITAASASLNQAERTREATASQLMRDVLSAYWELWYAERALILQRESLAVAEQQLQETRVRVETLGTAARTDLHRFATERSSMLEAVASAEATRRTRAYELGRLLGLAPPEAASLRLVDDAPAIAAPVPAELAIEAALTQAPELHALEQQIEAERARAATARNAAKTRLDVVSTLGASGLWADDSLRGLELPGSRPALVGTIGLELELPVGGSQLDANLASALATKSQAEAQLEARQAQLRADVASSHETLSSAMQRVALSQDSVDNARAVVEGEQQRLSLGTATSSDVILAQQTFRETELRRLRTVVDAAVASARLRQATGQLLSDNRELASSGGAR